MDNHSIDVFYSIVFVNVLILLQHSSLAQNNVSWEQRGIWNIALSETNCPNRCNKNYLKLILNVLKSFHSLVVSFDPFFRFFVTKPPSSATSPPLGTVSFWFSRTLFRVFMKGLEKRQELFENLSYLITLYFSYVIFMYQLWD